METNPQITIPIPIEKVFTLEEHEQFKPEHLPYIASLGLDFVETDYEGTPRYLGITPDFKASYYIGADWLTDNTAVIVTPKMHDIDHISMFVTALKFAHSSSYFSKFYGIDFSKPKIESEKLDGILTPLMLIHFLSVIQKLLEKGLKKGYVSREENLQTKIKGKVILTLAVQNDDFLLTAIYQVVIRSGKVFWVNRSTFSYLCKYVCTQKEESFRQHQRGGDRQKFGQT